MNELSIVSFSRIGLALIVFASIIGIYVMGYSRIVQPIPSVHADIVTVRNGELYLLSDRLGEKRLTNNGKVKHLFQQRNGKILFGKGWEGGVPDSERMGGMHLSVMNENGTEEQEVTKDLVTFALFDATADTIYYTNDRMDLFARDEKGNSKKIQEKVLSPDLSSDRRYIVYQKLPPEWQPGHYFDGALGLTILDLQTGNERRITNRWEDFNPFWTPDGQHILFFSANEGGLASHFIINADGTEKKQLTNVGQVFVSDTTIPNPSETPIWSKDGTYFVYEADREIWVNEFSPRADAIVSARRVAYGKDPQWLTDGKSIVVIAAEGQKGKNLLRVDLQGTILP